MFHLGSRKNRSVIMWYISHYNMKLLFESRDNEGLLEHCALSRFVEVRLHARVETWRDSAHSVDDMIIRLRTLRRILKGTGPRRRQRESNPLEVASALIDQLEGSRIQAAPS